MTAFQFRAGLAVTAATVALTAAHAQLPPVPAPPAKVYKWPGGWMVTDGKGVIIRNTTLGTGTTNIISGSGNGVGNNIVVGGGSGGGTTIIQNSRNGIGNQIVLDPDDWVLDLDRVMGKAAIPPAGALPPLPTPQSVALPRVYDGKANTFWKQKAFNEVLDCNIYWSATEKLWYRYHAETDKYKPLAAQPPAPKE